MIQVIQKQTIDGFCVGEPWNIQSKVQGYSQIIPEVTDQILATTQGWAQNHPNTLKAVTQASVKAQHELKKIMFHD